MDSPIIKLNNIISDAIKNCPKGDNFFDIVDDQIKDPKNKDIIFKLFEEIYEDFGYEYNMVLSGEFSEYIIHLVKKSKIICNGIILQVSGSLTSHKGELGKIIKNKEVSIIYKNKDISEKNFIFVDDSYFSGTTEKSINEYLAKFNSRIIKTYVVYDGNIKKDPNRIYLYNYFDNHKGVKMPIRELLEFMHKFKDIPYDVFQDKIIKGNITTFFDLKKQINKFHSIVKSGKSVNPFSHSEGVRIKNFDDFITESIDNSDLLDIKDVFQEIADKYFLRYEGRNSLHEMDTDIFYDKRENVYTIYAEDDQVSIDILMPSALSAYPENRYKEFKKDILNFKKSIKSIGYVINVPTFDSCYLCGIIYTISIKNISNS